MGKDQMSNGFIDKLCTNLTGLLHYVFTKQYLDNNES